MAHGIYINDLVVLTGETSRLGSVLLTHMQHEMTWEASEAIQRNGGHVQRHRSVTKRQRRLFTSYDILEPNIALVDFLHHTELVKYNFLEVRHRRFNVGDPVKRHPGDAMSGIVLATTSAADLEPLGGYTLENGITVPGSSRQAEEKSRIATFTKGPLIENIPVAALERSESLNSNTILVYKDWIGIVEIVRASLLVRLCNGTLVELIFEARFDGVIDQEPTHVGDFVTTTKSHVRQGIWVLGQYNPNIPPCGTVVRVRNREVDVRWLDRRRGCNTPEPPRVLERMELDSPELHVYSWIPMPTPLTISTRASYFENDIAHCMRVKFQHPAIGQELVPNQYTPRTTTSGFDLNVFDVSSLKTGLRVLWQDATITEEDSLSLCVEEKSLHDEHVAWVGEVARTVDTVPVPSQSNVFAPAKVGIVQAVDAVARTAWMRWCPSATLQYLRMDEGSGSEEQMILHRVGVADGPAELVSLYDIVAPPQLNLSRGDLVMLDAEVQAGMDGLQGITWMGTLVDEYLTGELVIRLSAALPVRDIVLRREQVILVIAFDSLNKHQVLTGDMDYDDVDVDQSTEDEMDEDHSEMSNDAEQDAIYQIQYDGEEAQEVERMDLEVDADDWESLDEEIADHGRVSAEATTETIEEIADYERILTEAMRDTTKEPDMPKFVEAPSPCTHGESTQDEDTTEHGTVHTTTSAYIMHEGQAPDDHRFITSPISDDNIRASRLQKEHRILQRPGSLPEGVYVHAWDSRLDLLRVLFIGSSDTAYEDCPFIIDFYLPETFPHSPPKAFFHSWLVEHGLGAVGKVNPNLYEDGKVCLSLLGTWEGKASERWSHASTLLQVVVSILGLVLVKEPYWNEPGFDAQMGTDEGKRQVMLYNERIMLRSLGFAIVAVEALRSGRSLSGTTALRDQLMSLYIGERSHNLLERLERRVGDTLQRSETSSEADGLRILSKGACIALSKVHLRLQQLHAAFREARSAPA